MEVGKFHEAIVLKVHFITSFSRSLFYQSWCHQFRYHFSQSDLLLHAPPKPCILEKAMMQYYMLLLYFHLIMSTSYKYMLENYFRFGNFLCFLFSLDFQCCGRLATLSLSLSLINFQSYSPKILLKRGSSYWPLS